MVGGNHHHHAEHGKQGQHHVFAAEQAAHGEVLARIHQHHRHGQIGQQLQHVGHQVIHEHVVEGMYHAVLMRADGNYRTAQQSKLHQHVGDQPAALPDHQVGDQDHAHHDQQKDFRCGWHQISHQIHIHLKIDCKNTGTKSLSSVFRPLSSDYGSLLCATCTSRSFTDACMTSLNGRGYSPMPSTVTARIAMIVFSRKVRSVSSATCELAAAPKITRLYIHKV